MSLIRSRTRAKATVGDLFKSHDVGDLTFFFFLRKVYINHWIFLKTFEDYNIIILFQTLDIFYTIPSSFSHPTMSCLLPLIPLLLVYYIIHYHCYDSLILYRRLPCHLHSYCCACFTLITILHSYCFLHIAGAVSLC